MLAYRKPPALSEVHIGLPLSHGPCGLPGSHPPNAGAGPDTAWAWFIFSNRKLLFAEKGNMGHG